VHLTGMSWSTSSAKALDNRADSKESGNIKHLLHRERPYQFHEWEHTWCSKWPKASQFLDNILSLARLVPLASSDDFQGAAVVPIIDIKSNGRY